MNRITRLPSQARRLTTLRTAQPLVQQIPIDNSLELFVASDGNATVERPANGGLRLWSYENRSDAIEEAARLATGMAHKHGMYNTGFSGGKLVCYARSPADLSLAVKEKKRGNLSSYWQGLEQPGRPSLHWV